MRVLTIQDASLEICGRAWPRADMCNYSHALPVYHRLFADYNRIKGTQYTSFFWAFSDLRVHDLVSAIKRACEMCGKHDGKVYVLDVPSELCLETDFYNFSDEIYACQYPDELTSLWETIYDKRDSERQVIIPFIDEHWIVFEADLDIEQSR